MGAVGIIVNPWAGKDVRRLHAPVGHTPDTAKIGIVRRVVIGALDAGASRVYAAADLGRIAERAIRGVHGAELVEGPGTGSARDTRRAAGQLTDLGCCPVVVLGGDGTCRDAAIGSPGITLVPISTGTNNVFPRFVDGSSAGAAAGLIASGRVPADEVCRAAKRLVVTITALDGVEATDIALVDVAVVTGTDAGARAVLRPGTIQAVVAAIAHPTSTGLSSIAGRVHPVDREGDGAVLVRVGDPTTSARRVRAPIVPGHFDVIGVDEVAAIGLDGSVTFHGPVVLAYDGERERVVLSGATATVRVDHDGPQVVDIDRTLVCAAERRLFDEPAGRSHDSSPTHAPSDPQTDPHPEAPHGR